jgi:hypothetical protein
MKPKGQAAGEARQRIFLTSTHDRDPLSYAAEQQQD